MINLKRRTEIVKIKPSLTRIEFENAISNNEEIYGFFGGIELTIKETNQEVPEHFINSTIQVDEETTKQKTWLEYSGTAHFNSLDGTKIGVFVGYRDVNGNRQDLLPSNELYDWVNYWGVERIQTKSESLAKLSSPDYYKHA